MFTSMSHDYRIDHVTSSMMHLNRDVIANAHRQCRKDYFKRKL